MKVIGKLIAVVAAVMSMPAHALNYSENHTTVATFVTACTIGNAVASTNLTTTGGKVRVDVQALLKPSGSGYTYWQFLVFRDTTIIFDSSFGGAASLSYGASIGVWTAYDTPSATLHTYRLAICTNVGGNAYSSPGTGISAWELK